MRVFLTTLGCKLNQAEMERLARELSAAGHAVVERLEDAEIHVVNSCAVTHVAARDSRKAARRGARVGGEVQTLVTGCLASVDPGQLEPLEGVALVVPNTRKGDLSGEIQRLQETDPAKDARLNLLSVGLAMEKARAAVKIQDGCGMPCAYCIVPRARGGSVSVPLPDIVREVRGLEDLGVEEIVVTGVQISSYGWNGLRLPDVVRALLTETRRGRIRLSSIAPWRLTDDLLDLLGNGRLCRHLHLSLQSGCDETLRRMRRPYTVEAFRAAVAAARKAVPGVAVTTDVIVGFPGESDDHFQESLRFVEEMGFSRIHAFPYSQRPDTEAANLPDPVSPIVARERMKALLAAARQGEMRFWESRLGEKVEVLWEGERDGLWQGMTDHYIKVHTEAGNGLQLGRLGPARLKEIRGGRVWVEEL